MARRHEHQGRDLRRAHGIAPIPIDGDGAAAAVQADIGFASEAKDGAPVIARKTGLSGHVRRARARSRPVRGGEPVSPPFDVPAPWSVPPATPS